MAKYVPSEHYVTWQNWAEENPIAKMTVLGKVKGADQRKNQAKNWAERNEKGLGAVKVTYENKPQSGFIIENQVNYRGNHTNDWLVHDPRGFRVNITISNLAYLLKYTSINNGKIDEELIWVRNGPTNRLILTDSEEFKNYKKTTDALEKEMQIKDVPVGSKIAASTGEIGIYLGCYTTIEIFPDACRIMSVTRKHFIKDVSDSANIKYISKIKWSGVTILDIASTDDDYIQEINDAINKDARYVTNEKLTLHQMLKTIKAVPCDEINPDNFYIYGCEKKTSKDKDLLLVQHYSTGPTVHSSTFQPMANYMKYNNARIGLDTVSKTKSYRSRYSISLPYLKNAQKFIFAFKLNNEYIRIRI